MWDWVQELTHTKSGRSLLAFIIVLPFAAAVVLRALLVRTKSGPSPREPSAAHKPLAGIDAAARRAEAAVIARVRRQNPNTRAFHFGAVDIHPSNLAIWIVTDTDAERDALEEDANLSAELRGAIAASGYPAEGVASVGLAFESEETVRRSFGGDWWQAVK